MAFFRLGQDVDGGFVPSIATWVTAVLGYTPANKNGDTFGGNVTVNGTLNCTGTFTSSADVVAYSDERLKTNWRSVGAAFLDNLAHIKAGIFDRIDKPLTQAGVSAQDVQKFLPHVVHDNDGTLSIAYGQLATVACVELAKEVLALRKELEDLKARL